MSKRILILNAIIIRFKRDLLHADTNLVPCRRNRVDRALALAEAPIKRLLTLVDERIMPLGLGFRQRHGLSRRWRLRLVTKGVGIVVAVIIQWGHPWLSILFLRWLVVHLCSTVQADDHRFRECVLSIRLCFLGMCLVALGPPFLCRCQRVGHCAGGCYTDKRAFHSSCHFRLPTSAALLLSGVNGLYTLCLSRRWQRYRRCIRCGPARHILDEVLCFEPQRHCRAAQEYKFSEGLPILVAHRQRLSPQYRYRETRALDHSIQTVASPYLCVLIRGSGLEPFITSDLCCGVDHGLIGCGTV